MNMNIDMKYFIYCRKSSESEDKQILSLPAQERELKEFANKCGLKIVGNISESKSAFKTGREGFNSMLERIEAGEANAILTWQANRIARNSKDGGDFIYLMDENKILELKTPYKTFSNSPDDKFFLALEFGIAKKDSDEKSKNVKRGNREKFLEQRIWIGPAKQGYLNYMDPMTKEKSVIPDKERLPLIEKAFRLLLAGSYTPGEVFHKLNSEWSYRTRKTRRQGAKPLAKSGFYKVLNDPFYYGLMVRREGEVMGKHHVIITKEEFERIQVMLGSKGRPHFAKYEFPYKGVLKCGECQASITAEHKWQIICSKCKTKFNRGRAAIQCPECSTQIYEMKNYKLLHYIYYHCTKKAHPDCSQGSLTIEKIEEQIRQELIRFEISEKFKDWAIEHLNELNDSEVVDRETIRKSQQSAYNDCVKRLDNLLKMKISPQNANGDVIGEDEYIEQRKKLLTEKESLLSKINDINKRIDNWLELSERTFNFACYAKYWFENGDLKTKTRILAALGSNLTIKDKKLWVNGLKPFFLIERGLEEVKVVAEKFEPAKELDFTNQTPLLEAVRSYWLGD
jgi:site-specific DNA recombinase